MSGGFRVQIKPGSIKLKTDADGKTKFIPAVAYTSVSDKLNRGTKRKIVKGKRV